MKQLRRRLVCSIITLAMLSLVSFGQGSTAPLSGIVTDPNGEVVAGAEVTVRNNATATEFKAVTAGNGAFTVPALGAGTYTVTVSAAGFKQAVVNNVKLDAGVPASVRVSLEIGGANETVNIQGGGDVVQTQTANIATTLAVKQIASLPLQSRNVLDFVVFLPGTNTTGGPRTSSINGLPDSALNITIDGINSQDNTLKTTDGFFSYISPRLDAIEEVTVSTATPGAESGGQGAVQIKFVTRGGTNDLHGSLYHYHRNPVLNSNYWFTNRDGAQINKDTGLPCDGSTPQQSFDPEKCRAQRARVLLNQFGGRLGGPITLPKKLFGRFGFDGRNKAFFFVNYEEFRLPNQVTRTRTILNPRTQQGFFQYNFRRPDGSTEVREVNLFDLAARNGQLATIDPMIGRLLADIRTSTAKGAVRQLTDPNLQQFTFNNSSMDKRYYPTVRLDFNLTSKHRLESVYNYNRFNNSVDTLNGIDPAFPGFQNLGGQTSHRFSESLTLRSTLTPALVNEARFGLVGGVYLFRAAINPGQFTNQGGFSLGGAPGNNSTGIAAAMGINGPTASTTTERRNAPLWDFSDTLTWTRGAHNLSFGGQFTQINLWVQNQTVVPTINFAINSNEPAFNIFNQANFPGASTADIDRARNMYAALTGRISSINANAGLDEKTGQYKHLGPRVQRGRQRELGVFAQDSWRMRPGLTLNYGLRWELQLPFTPLNGSYSTTTVEGLFGVSGPGNLFKPGTMTGQPTEFIQFKDGEAAYNADYKNFAPSFGFAWSPNVKDGWLSRLLGDSGQTVVRGGYSIAYNRNGIGDYANIFTTNPGVTITANRNLNIGNLAPIDQLPILLRETSRLGPPAIRSTPGYPFRGEITDTANIIDPNIRIPYTQSWTFGIQREITKDMAIEVRYVGTRNLKGWSDFNFNAVDNNVRENGVLGEFRLAQANLQANNAAGGARAGSFAYFGPNTGTVPLPISLAYLTGNPRSVADNPAMYPNNQTSLFRNALFVNPLALFNPAPHTFATNLHSDAIRRQNALNAGLPANFFLTNPDLRGGVELTSNSGYTRYDSMVVELRRRLSKGLLAQGSYVFAKGFSSTRPLTPGSTTVASFRAPRVNTLGGTLRHAFKVNWVYELPIGKGKLLFGKSGGLLDRVVGGWEFDGAARIQSGNLLDFGNVRLAGMTQKEFRKQFGLYFDDANKVIYHLPKDIIDNTIRAFSISTSSATGYSGPPPTGRYIAPANTASCLQVVSGECAPNNLYVTGPKFTRFDLSLVKRIRFNERFDFELRGEFLNAFNNINYFANTNMTNFTNAQFGQVTSSYRDVNNTQDPGGRLAQIVLRLNF